MVDLHAKVVSSIAGAGEGHHIRVPHACAFDRSPTASATELESALLFTNAGSIQPLTVTGTDTDRMVVVWDSADNQDAAANCDAAPSHMNALAVMLAAN